MLCSALLCGVSLWSSADSCQVGGRKQPQSSKQSLGEVYVHTDTCACLQVSTGLILRRPRDFYWHTHKHTHSHVCILTPAPHTHSHVPSAASAHLSFPNGCTELDSVSAPLPMPSESVSEQPLHIAHKKLLVEASVFVSLGASLLWAERMNLIYLEWNKNNKHLSSPVFKGLLLPLFCTWENWGSWRLTEEQGVKAGFEQSGLLQACNLHYATDWIYLCPILNDRTNPELL